MTDPNDPSVSVSRADDGSLTVQGVDDAAEESSTWEAARVDDKRVLLYASEDRKMMAGVEGGFAQCSVHVFKDMLDGLCREGWSGAISVDTGYGIKKLFFSDGRISFAASNLMDDRLGEVIYREARINLDELTDSAAQVTKTRKFGQVLLSSGIFNNIDLWDALKLQVRQVVRSVFMVPTVYFEMQEGRGLAPTEVVFSEGGRVFVSRAYAYGCDFQEFLSRLRAESYIELQVPLEKARESYGEGTFYGDLLGLIAEEDNIQSLLDASKLIDAYTIAAINHLVKEGLCALKPAFEAEDKPAAPSPEMKSKIDAYGYVLNSVKRAFSDAGQSFPVGDLQRFATSLSEDEGFPALFLAPGGELTKECIHSLFRQCRSNRERISYLEIRLESLIQFLLQVAGDNLDRDTAKKIRGDYRAIAM